jgi:hypothetical protein
MSIPDQYPRRFSRAVPATAAPPGGTMGDGGVGPPDVEVAPRSWPWRRAAPGRDTELLAEAGGLLMGRFLLTPAPAALPQSSGWSPPLCRW